MQIQTRSLLNPMVLSRAIVDNESQVSRAAELNCKTHSIQQLLI